MDWIAHIKGLLESGENSVCEPLEIALDKLKGGRFDLAGEQLKGLEENQRLLCLCIIEIEAIRLGASNEEITLLSELFNTEVHVNSINDRDLSLEFVDYWIKTVSPYLSPDQVQLRSEYLSRGQSVLYRSVLELIKLDRHIDAFELALLYDTYYRESYANLWGSIAVCLPEGDKKNQAIERAYKAGSIRPMIQNGGEESAAFGIALKHLIQIPLSTDHPAIQFIHKGLHKLAKTYAEKDVRSDGVSNAAVAAARAAIQFNDNNWLEFAKSFECVTWSDHLKTAVQVSIAIADEHLNKAPDIPTQHWLKKLNLSSQEELKLWVDETLYGGRLNDPYVEAVKQQRAGEDVEARFDELLNDVKYGEPNATRFINACRLCLEDKALDALLDKIPEREKKEALVWGSRWGFYKQPERVMKYLVQGYPEGDVFGSKTSGLLHFLTPDMLLKGEIYFAENDRQEGLISIASQYISKGDMASASRVIGRIGHTKYNEKWRPRYKQIRDFNDYVPSGLKHDSKNIYEPKIKLSVDEIKSHIKLAKKSEDLWEIVESYEITDALKSALLKAVNLKKYQKGKSNLLFNIRIRTYLNELEGISELIRNVSRIKTDWPDVPFLELLQEHLLLNPSHITAETYSALMFWMGMFHPQDVTEATFNLAKMALLTEESFQNEAINSVAKFFKLKYRYKSDHCFGFVGLAQGSALVGDQDSVEYCLDQAFTVLSERCTYMKGRWLIRKIAPLKQTIGNDVWMKYVLKAFQYIIEMEDNPELELEFSYRELWSYDGDDALIALLESSLLPKKLREHLCRSIWFDIEHSNMPDQILISSSPPKNLPYAIRFEFSEAVNRVLKLNNDIQCEAMEKYLNKQ